MTAHANGGHGVPIEASDERQTGRLPEEDNEEWRPMPSVPFGLLRKLQRVCGHSVNRP